MTKRLMLLADEYASAYKNNLALHPSVERSRAALESALEDELSKLRGLIAGRSAEYLAAHITYDKGYQEGRLDAEAALEPVIAQLLEVLEAANIYNDEAYESWKARRDAAIANGQQWLKDGSHE